jgi:hypothetical protein
MKRSAGRRRAALRCLASGEANVSGELRLIA